MVISVLETFAEGLGHASPRGVAHCGVLGPVWGGGHGRIHPADRGQALPSCPVACVTEGRSPLRAQPPAPGGLWGQHCQILGRGPAVPVVVLPGHSPLGGDLSLCFWWGGGDGGPRASPPVGRVGLPARPGCPAPQTPPSLPAFQGYYHQGLAWPRVSGLPVLVLPEAPGQVIGLADRAAGPRTGSPIVLTAHGLTTRVRNSVAPSL